MIKEIEDSFIRLRDEADETTCAKRGERVRRKLYIDNVKQSCLKKNRERKFQTKITTLRRRKKLKHLILSKVYVAISPTKKNHNNNNNKNKK